MTWAEDIYSTLTGDAGVTAYVGTNVFPHAAEVETTRPFITYQLVGGVPENHLGNVPTLDSRRIQINCTSTDYKQTQDLAEAVRTALEPLGYLSLEIDLQRDSDTRLFSTAQDWAIFFSRS